jgi:CheY-like chemotaxis protein/anti-sigma regulatory factor (Ser/Thr protein kinase)
LLLDGDPVRLTQVLANLLNNAAKYTEVGGEISLTVGRDGAELFASVRDTGVGLAPELLPRVFDSFAQLDGTYYRKQGGLGIGLTLVKRLVEMHGGRVEARSEGPGRGSEFIVRLPLAVAARAPEAAPPNNLPAFAQQRILVVDDNHDGAVTLAMLLQVYGAEVIVAHDGITALDVLKASRPSVLLVDIGMPGMDGYELARRARQIDGDALTIIAVTGWGQAKDRSLSKAAGIDHHLVKPIDCEALVALLQNAERTR